MTAPQLQQLQGLFDTTSQRLVNWLERFSSNESDEWVQPAWTVAALCIFVGILLSLWRNGWEALDRPITEVQLLGETRHLDRQELAETLARELRDSSLLSQDVERLRDRIEEEPWVLRAAVALQWPGRVQVTLQEEVPVARWGEKGLLNQQGDIFWPELKEEYRGLPLLRGPARDTARLMAEFHQLNQLMKRAGLNIEALQLEARGAWTLMLDNGIRVIVGRQDEEERLARFLKVYQAQLAEKAADIEQVDIRYSNGIAVRWRPAVANEEKQINDGDGQ